MQRIACLTVAVLAFAVILAGCAHPFLCAVPDTVKVAAVQCSSQLGDVAGNSAKLNQLIKEAAGNGAKIVVLPEVAITGYMSQDGKTIWQVGGRPIEKQYVGKDLSGFAETVPGPSTKHFCKLARDLGIYLTIPLVEVDLRDGPEKPRYFNTVCLANPHGEMVLHYRKLNPWPYAEQSWATDGDRGLQTFDTEYGRVGVAVCYDIHMVVEKYHDKGLWALLYPTAWVDGEYPEDWFYNRLPAKVKSFNHHLIAANWSVDGNQDWRGFGFSVIISRDGKVLSGTRSVFGSNIVYADLPVRKYHRDNRT